MELDLGRRYRLPPGIPVTVEPGRTLGAVYELIGPGRWGRWLVAPNGDIQILAMAGRGKITARPTGHTVADLEPYETAAMGPDPRTEYRG